MQKTRRIYWYRMVLLFIAALAVCWWRVPIAFAADQQGYDDPCTGGHNEPTLGGTQVVETSQFICNDLTIFGGTLVIKGQVKGDIVAFGGTISIAGRVYGNLDVYGGKVTLLPGSVVHGDIHLYGGDWVQENGAQLDGAVLYHTKHGSWWFLLDGGGEFHFPFWQLLTWVALGLLVTSLLPEHVMFVRTTVVSKPRRSLLIGLLSTLLTPPVLIVLSALIISIPVAIVLLLAMVAAWALGTIAVAWLAGEYIVRKVAPQHNTRLAQVVVGLTVVTLAGSLPYIGLLVSLAIGLLGFGAVLLSRFGTRLYSRPKQLLTI